ncbi:aldo/keto reductase [Halomonas sp. FeN2]|uniref:Aldo/keto reductase n=1 Tax=Vreelandella neptunia TaxID=115551 RepID=A0ABZ0YRM0_9GAMM|nr:MULTISPECIES: aldo/keto reductase [Halomonas]TDV98158.1 diketogulonate reductase-like aldo/keto reductase [Halomonas alkaliantarctica]MBF59194.1 aldo/keto reductase [Halomonas sp.]MDN3558902.1 aldo/keto reductase [Halomonas neptunia]UBR49058.1 aldo/keto reductase [Halomonas sp. FeN2]WQH13867.1 aldo/keto reductase [Halomonas neptunia]|tara:strand:- start:1333 stop:2292 length:960 start_codon:yes stop_codon:yes gene_type:complete
MNYHIRHRIKHGITRRQSLTLIGATLAAMALPTASLFANTGGMRHKTFAGTDKTLPVIGMGTWRTFNVGSDPELLDARTEVVKAFFEYGGGLIDSSPMYGSAPDVMGYALQQLGTPESLFSAEKVWSPAGGSAGEQVAELKERWKVEHFDLVQVHNLTDWREHLAALQEMKAEGIIRHVGITTSHSRRHREIEQIMTSEDIDFVQLTYNITHREAENRLLPLAEERGIGVIANRPYDGGSLIQNLKRRDAPLPEWANEECGCTTWADFLLKFIVSHPAVTCAIPATTQVEHLRENMRAGHDPMPSANARQRMAAYIESL